MHKDTTNLKPLEFFLSISQTIAELNHCRFKCIYNRSEFKSFSLSSVHYSVLHTLSCFSLQDTAAVSVHTSPRSPPLKDVSPALKCWVRCGPQGGVHRHRRPPARSNGQWGILGPFQSLKSPSATAQLHGRRLSICLVNYQPAPAFTVVHTQVAR